MTFTRSAAAIRHAETRKGDTLQDIAAREMGDASQWHLLATLNDLVAPYLVDDLSSAGPRVLLAGQQTILIPASGPPASGVVDEQSVFGTDVALVRGRLAADAGQGIATVSGTANLAAALRRRIRSPLGVLRYHPSYGCLAYTLIGRGGSQSIAQLAAAYVARAIRSDSRVASASGAKASLIGDTISATATAITIDGKKVPVGTS